MTARLPRDRAPRWPWAALLALAAGLVSSCQDDTLEIKKVLVEIAPQLDGKIDKERCRPLVNAAIDAHPRTRQSPNSKDALVLRARLLGLKVRTAQNNGELADENTGNGERGAGGPNADAQTAPDEGPYARVGVEVAGVRRGVRVSWRGTATYRPDDERTATDGYLLFKGALAEALSIALDTRGIEGLDTLELIALVKNPDVPSKRRRQAMRVLAERKDRRATAAIAEVLEGDDDRLAPDALGALVRLGDPAAVDALIRYSEGRPPVVKRQVIEAVRVLGTHRGEAWLFTLSTGHPDHDVQKAARSALAFLDHEDGASAKSADESAMNSPGR